LLFFVNKLRNRSNDSNNVSHVFFAQITFLNIDKNAFTFPSILGEALKINSRNKDFCRNNKVEALILLKVIKFNCTKDYYNATS